MFFIIYLLIILTLFFSMHDDFHVFLIDLLTKPNEKSGNLYEQYIVLLLKYKKSSRGVNQKRQYFRGLWLHESFY